jgi:hypothetical protein
MPWYVRVLISMVSMFAYWVQEGSDGCVQSPIRRECRTLAVTEVIRVESVSLPVLG